jgi:hypothetical protein
VARIWPRLRHHADVLRPRGAGAERPSRARQTSAGLADTAWLKTARLKMSTIPRDALVPGVAGVIKLLIRITDSAP